METNNAKDVQPLTLEKLHVVQTGGVAAVPARIFIWAHGWGRDHQDFLPAAESLHNMGAHYLLDFPGFGETPRPPETWGTAAYADFLADWVKTLPAGVPIYWVGHSFGCRVGLRLAAQHPHLLRGLFLVAPPGLPRRIPLYKKAYRWLKVRVYKLLKHMVHPDWLSRYFGSTDYKNAGAMRDILVATVREDLTDITPHVTCPVYLCCGAQDKDVPPETGKKYMHLLPQAQLQIVPGADHSTLLTMHRHVVMHQLKKWIKEQK